MIAKALFLFLCVFLPYEVYGGYDSIGDFKSLNINNAVVYLQENPLSIVTILSDMKGHLQPFIEGFFGYNRLSIAQLANETLLTLKPSESGRLNVKQSKCMEDNKKIIVLILADATADWYCIKSHLIELVDLINPIWATLFEFTLVHQMDCTFGPFCLMQKGLQVGKLSGQMLGHGAKILKFFTNLVFGLRSCQRDITHFREAVDKVVFNMHQICTRIYAL